MNRFQGISCLISKEILLVKNNNFSNQRPYRSVHLCGKLHGFSSNDQILRKMNIFHEIKEITDFNQFSKRAFYRSVLLHENFQCFGPNHDISNKGLYEADFCILTDISGKSIDPIKYSGIQ